MTTGHMTPRGHTALGEDAPTVRSTGTAQSELANPLPKPNWPDIMLPSEHNTNTPVFKLLERIAELEQAQMTEAKAIAILGDTIRPDNGLYCLGHYIAWHKGDDDICLDCRFSADELAAMAWWMRNKT